MHSTLIISIFLLSSASAFHFFNIYPAQKCNDGEFNLCEDISDFLKDAVKPCGDGTYCSTATCGTWLGKKGMCCGDIANLAAEGTITNQLTQACTPFKKQLENYDISSSGNKPLTDEACKNNMKTFGVGVGVNETADFLTGNTTTYKSCCAMTTDAITLYSDFLNKVDEAVCIPPIDGKGGSGSGSGKSLGANVVPSVGGLVISSVLVMLAGSAAML